MSGSLSFIYSIFFSGLHVVADDSLLDLLCPEEVRMIEKIVAVEASHLVVGFGLFLQILEAHLGVPHHF